MSKKLLIYIASFLIVFQSAFVVADVHQEHQSGVDHVEFDHQHVDHEPLKVSDSDEPEQSFDCHHCCHCHGATVTAIVSYLGAGNLVSSSSHAHQLSYEVQTGIHTNLFRPPIA